MSAAAVGVDLIEIARLERALERRPALGERLFTPGERRYAIRRRRPARHLAARFAAKEAAVKALASADGDAAIPLREIEVAASPAPVLHLYGAAARAAAAKGVELSVSLTHSRELAAAVVVAVPVQAR